MPHYKPNRCNIKATRTHSQRQERRNETDYNAVESKRGKPEIYFNFFLYRRP